jgi:hypothetical protein
LIQPIAEALSPLSPLPCERHATTAKGNDDVIPSGLHRAERGRGDVREGPLEGQGPEGKPGATALIDEPRIRQLEPEPHSARGDHRQTPKDQTGRADRADKDPLEVGLDDRHQRSGNSEHETEASGRGVNPYVGLSRGNDQEVRLIEYPRIAVLLPF